MRPAVTVLLPVRNGLPWLPGVFASLYAQTRRDFEIIAVDDGSVDGTGSWLQREPDPRLRVVTGPGRGLAVALNVGLAHSAAELIARQDVDDLSHPERIARQVAFLDANPDVSVLATCAEYIGPDGAVLQNDWTRTIRSQQDVATTPEALAELLPLTCGVVHGSVMMRAAAIRAVGGYRDDYPVAEDYDLWLRLLPAHRFAKLPDRLYSHRVHPQQSSGEHAATQLESTVSAKLAFVRRACPWLPAEPRMVIADDTRGTPVYRALAPRCGFRVISGKDGEGEPAWDVLVVTDFGSLPAVGEAFRPDIQSRRVVRLGNLFVKNAEDA